MAVVSLQFIVCFFGIFTFSRCTLGERLLYTHSGEVEGDTYTYYTLLVEGPIALYLHSTTGDADLYVSQFVTNPTFDPETYCLHSATCGLDTVYIPASFKRPVAIGVYGHVFHKKSSYKLEVVYREEDEEEFYDFYPSSKEEEDFIIGERSEEENQKDLDSKLNDYADDETDSFIWTVIWSVFDILLEVLFL